VLKLNDIDLGNGRSRLEMMAAEATPAEDGTLRALLPAAAARARTAAKHWNFTAPAGAINELVLNPENLPACRDAEGKHRLQRVVVARLALNHFQLEDTLPSSILSLYPSFLKRLSASELQRSCEAYRDDFFAKDVRYALGLTVPGGALQFDPSYRIGPKLILRDWASSRSARAVFAYVKSGAWGRWYRFHLDLRWMREFHAEGWNRFYGRMAEALTLNPNVLGIVSMGWFYDPQVAAITPNLAYVQAPIAHGAFRVHIGSNPNEIQNATFRSAARRELYDRGEYVPTSYLMAWPRAALISWAGQVPVSKGHRAPIAAVPEQVRSHGGAA